MTHLSEGLGAASARRARMADLTVVARPYGPGRGPFAIDIAEGLIFGGGAALVLVAPDGFTDWSRPWRRLCLAWDGSAPALRAVRAALPFLRVAGEVDIAIVAPPPHATGEADPGADLALLLDRHGPKVEVTIFPRSEPRVADVLARFARERDADAIVMGAYGHGRLREAAFGGARATCSRTRLCRSLWGDEMSVDDPTTLLEELRMLGLFEVRASRCTSVVSVRVGCRRRLLGLLCSSVHHLGMSHSLAVFSNSRGALRL